MSLISRIATKLAGTTVRTLKPGSQAATKAVAAGEVKIGGFNFSLNSPAADTFIASTKKQGAKIIGDNVCIPAGKVQPVRVVTKRLPSGTTVSEVFDPAGQCCGKEVLHKNGRTLYYGMNYPNLEDRVILADTNKGIRLYKMMYAGKGSIKTLPKNVEVKDMFLNGIDGITEFANARNPLYQTLKDNGLVH